MHGRSVSTVTAYTAHREWARRPPDERYASVHALAEAARARRIRTDARITETVDLQVQTVTADALAISDRSGPSRALTHWSFEQLAGLAGAPPAYLRTLPAPIAADAINYGLQRADRAQHQLFADRDEPWTSTRSPHRGTRGSTMTSWPTACSTSWPSTRPGTCRSVTRTA